MIRRKPLRSNSSTRGWSTSSWIMVGTRRTSVMPCSAIAVMTATGSNIGIMTWGPPRARWLGQGGGGAGGDTGAGGRVGGGDRGRGGRVGAPGAEEVLAGEHAERRGQQVGVAQHDALGAAG